MTLSPFFFSKPRDGKIINSMGQIRQKLVLSAMKVGRKFLKNTAFEDSAVVLWVYNRLFNVGFRSESGAEAHFKLKGHDFVMSASDKSMLPGLLNGTYEKYEIEFFCRTIQPGWIVLDIGANIGIYGRLASELVGPEGRVFCFEPAPATRVFLERNLDGCKNVTIVPKAVSVRSGSATLYIQEADTGGNSLLSKTGSSTKVDVVSVDEWVGSESQIKRVNFIKMDIEGFEEEAIRGMSEVLKTSPILLVELNPSLLVKNGRDPKLFLDFLKAKFASIAFICERTGALKPISSLDDLGYQRIANLVLKEPKS